jgi:uncharacterized protein
MDLAYPFHFDTSGRTASTGREDHLRALIQAVLFTSPGERVNRPTFGSGLLQLVFAPASDALAATTDFLVQGALQQWLGDLLIVNAVQIEIEESTLAVTVQYTERLTQRVTTATFTREVPT